MALGRGIGEGIRVALVDTLAVTGAVGVGVRVFAGPGEPIMAGVAGAAVVIGAACPVHSAMAVNGRVVADATA